MLSQTLQLDFSRAYSKGQVKGRMWGRRWWGGEEFAVSSQTWRKIDAYAISSTNMARESLLLPSWDIKNYVLRPLLWWPGTTKLFYIVSCRIVTKPRADTHVVGPYLRTQANRIHTVGVFFRPLNFEAKAQQLPVRFCCRVLSIADCMLIAQLVPLYYRSSLVDDASISINQAAIMQCPAIFFTRFLLPTMHLETPLNESQGVPQL